MQSGGGRAGRSLPPAGRPARDRADRLRSVVAYDAAARGRGHGRVNQLDAARPRRGPRPPSCSTRPSRTPGRRTWRRPGPAATLGVPPGAAAGLRAVVRPGRVDRRGGRIGAFRAGRPRCSSGRRGHSLYGPSRRRQSRPLDGRRREDTTAGADEVRGRWLRQGGASIPLAREPAAICASARPPPRPLGPTTRPTRPCATRPG